LNFVAIWRELDRRQRNAFTASFLGWMLDAFDFFLMVFTLRAIAAEFGTDVRAVALGITLTLAMRPLGALVFGMLADRYGRRPVLMADILLFSLLEFASAFAPSLPALLVLRAAFGFAMGGEWGIGAALTMETLPPRARGLASGILQQGYAFGYIAAAIVYGLLFERIGWRGMFMVGVLPALLVLFIRRHVEESPAWAPMRGRPRTPIAATIRAHIGLFAYAVVLMTAMNFFSHGTQDLYPTFLQVQHGFSPRAVSLLVITGHLGAIISGTTVGALSQRIGRRRAIVGAALIAIPAIPLWAFGANVWLLALGVFGMQAAVQGAWGVIPIHLNELSPHEMRGTFPAFTYQLGNLFASINATWQAGIAQARGNDYAFALALVAGLSAVAAALITSVGPEARGASLGAD